MNDRRSGEEVLPESSPEQVVSTNAPLPSSSPRSLPDRAIALQYRQGDQLPRVIASGSGDLARRIVELAKDHNVAIQQDGALAQLLTDLPRDPTITPETYRILAEIISFLYHADQRYGQAAGKG